MKNQMNSDSYKITVPVKEIMKHNAVTVTAETTVDKAAQKMSNNGMGSCIVLHNNVPQGIVTEEDLTRKIVALNRKPGDVCVSEIMTTPLITIDSEMTVGEATDIMITRKVRRLPVVENNKVVGLITIREILPVTNELNGIMSEILKFTPEEIYRTGVCDSCGCMSDSLKMADGQFLCPNCTRHDDTD